MPISFSVLGLTFHLYGFILGVAMVVAAQISEKIYSKTPTQKLMFWDAAVWIIVSGIIGARIWHVCTDWHLYQNNLIGILLVWRGGLSILGALIGGVIGIFVVTRASLGRLKFFQLSDALVIGVSFGQAIGRLGNWINQELYGRPTQLPWKIHIDESYRLPGFENQAYYHPLFAYELIAMIIVGSLLWKLSEKNRLYRIGTGMATYTYLALYGWLRFFLEFLRLDKAVNEQTGLGINQVIVGLVAICASAIVLYRITHRKIAA